MKECKLFEIILEDGKSANIYMPVTLSSIGMRTHLDQIFGYTWHTHNQLINDGTLLKELEE